MTKRICPVCGKPFEVAATNHRKYCSRECKLEGNRRAAKVRSMRRGHASPATYRELAGRPSVLTVADCVRCDGCRFRARSHGSGLVTCDFLLLTGEPRGCDVSETCGRFEAKEGGTE